MCYRYGAGGSHKRKVRWKGATRRPRVDPSVVPLVQSRFCDPTTAAHVNCKHNRERINTHGSVSRRRPLVLSGARLLPTEGLKGPIEVPRLKRSNVHQQPHKSNRSGAHSCRECTEIISTDAISAGRFHEAYFILLPRYLSFSRLRECCKFAGGFLCARRDSYRHRETILRWSLYVVAKNEDLSRVDGQKFMDS